MKPFRAAPRRALGQLFHSWRPQQAPSCSLRQPKLIKPATFSTTSTPIARKAPRRPVTWTELAARCARTTRNTTRRYKSSSTPPPPHEERLSFSQRMKKLSREYGWAAVGIYFALSALDFPFCFLAVRTLGTDRIGHWEHVVVSTIKEWLPFQIGSSEGHSDGSSSSGSGSGSGQEVDESEQHVDHGYKEAEAANRGSNASIWTQLALAYAIHKSFIFIRVPLTAAVTPKVVKTLRGWGWNIGKMPKRSSKTVD